MCFRMMQPPHGVPIDEETHGKFPDDVKEAWEIFDKWWKEKFDGSTQVNRASMPSKVATAFQKIKDAPIPGYDGATGNDSCYVAEVRMNMTE